MTLAEELVGKCGCENGAICTICVTAKVVNEAIERCESAILTVFPRNAAEERYGEECLAKLRALKGE